VGIGSLTAVWPAVSPLTNIEHGAELSPQLPQLRPINQVVLLQTRRTEPIQLSPTTSGNFEHEVRELSRSDITRDAKLRNVALFSPIDRKKVAQDRCWHVVHANELRRC
jgi:hypothetical protein